MLERTRRIWIGITVLATSAAVIAGLYSALVPAYSAVGTGTVGSAERPSPSAAPVGQASNGATLVEVNGAGVYLILLIPVLIAAAPLLLRKPLGRVVGSAASALFLFGFVALTGFSIGQAYAPAALIAGLGAFVALVGAVGDERPELGGA